MLREALARPSLNVSLLSLGPLVVLPLLMFLMLLIALTGVPHMRERGKRRKEERDRQGREKEKGRDTEMKGNRERILACLVKQERIIENKSVR